MRTYIEPLYITTIYNLPREDRVRMYNDLVDMYEKHEDELIVVNKPTTVVGMRIRIERKWLFFPKFRYDGLVVRTVIISSVEELYKINTDGFLSIPCAMESMHGIMRKICYILGEDFDE